MSFAELSQERAQAVAAARARETARALADAESDCVLFAAQVAECEAERDRAAGALGAVCLAWAAAQGVPETEAQAAYDAHEAAMAAALAARQPYSAALGRREALRIALALAERDAASGGAGPDGPAPTDAPAAEAAPVDRPVPRTGLLRGWRDRPSGPS